jgi:phage terminase small subunit
MPAYDFQCEETGEIISVYVPLKAPNRQRQIQKRKGKVYKRIYSAPTAAVDSRVKDASKEDFRRMTTGKKLSVGDMWDISKDMHQHRADKNGGVDEVKEQYYRDYERQNKVKHPDVEKREAAKKAAEEANPWGIRIEPD